MKIRAGIVGLGHIAETHLRHLAAFEDVALVACCDRDAGRLSEVGNRYGIPHRYPDLAHMLAHSRLDCVFIFTPDWAHAAQSILCLEQGLHVFCEKPPALTLADTRAMAEAEARSRRWLMIGYNRRFRFQPVKDVFTTAPPDLCTVEYVREALTPRGLLRGTCHVIDPLRWLCGEPKQVQAMAASSDPEREGNIVATIAFEGGALGTVVSSYGSGGSVERLEAHGQGISVFSEDGRTRIVRNDASGSTQEEAVPWTDSFLAEDRHFIDCIKQSIQPLISGQEAVRTMALIAAMLEAAGIDPDKEPVQDIANRGWTLWCPLCGVPLPAWSQTCPGCGEAMGGWARPTEAV
jgi:predicted dehydrogenase